jgi:beta-glucosidase
MDSGTKAFSMPSGTCLACTWNNVVVKELYNWEGLELRKNRIDSLLGPGMNIHRHPLNGRNFEYFSEDPFLTGKMAVVQLRGMRESMAAGTIKHFCANNQEYRRMKADSVISERALREIYLRGFEICVKESDPMALMTSYNLINGTHTSESRELVTALLRDEYGFDGLVMTDWVVGGGLLLQRGSKYGMPDAAKVAASGHSLFMPGSRKDLREVMAGLKDGTVTGKQLISNASWLLHVADRLGK